MLYLMTRIGEKMEKHYPLYKNLRDLKATKLIHKSTMATLPKFSRISKYLKDGDEVLFDLRSFDFWLKIKFAMRSPTHVVSGQVDARVEWEENVD